MLGESLRTRKKQPDKSFSRKTHSAIMSLLHTNGSGFYMFWEAIKKLYARLDTIPKASFAFLGCGLARAWLWWVLSLVSYSEAFPSYTEHQGHLLFDLGEIIGFFLLSFLAYRFSPFFKRSSIAVAALALTLLGGAWNRCGHLHSRYGRIRHDAHCGWRHWLRAPFSSVA